MIGRGDGAFRGLGRLAFAVLATALALAAHVVAGGAPAGPAATLLAALVAVVAATALRRPPGRLGHLTVLTATQLVQHEIFMAAPAPGHAHAHAAGLPMVAGHAAAIVATAAVLGHLDTVLSWCERWWAGVRPPLPVVLTAPVTGPARTSPVQPAGLLAVPVTRVDRRGVPRRGPPAVRS